MIEIPEKNTFRETGMDTLNYSRDAIKNIYFFYFSSWGFWRLCGAGETFVL